MKSKLGVLLALSKTINVFLCLCVCVCGGAALTYHGYVYFVIKVLININPNTVDYFPVVKIPTCVSIVFSINKQIYQTKQQQ